MRDHRYVDWLIDEPAGFKLNKNLNRFIGTAFVDGIDVWHGAGTPQHGLSSNKMALITSDCDKTRYPSTKWP